MRHADLRRSLLLAMPAMLLLAGFFVTPLLLLLRVSLYASEGGSGYGVGGRLYVPGTWTVGAYAGLLSDDYFWAILWFTLQLGLSSALLSLLIGFPIALLIAGLSTRAKLWAIGAVILPKLANVLVIIYGLEMLLSNIGPVNSAMLATGLIAEPLTLLHNWTGTLLGEVYLLLPYSILLLVAGLDRINPLLIPVARGLGAGWWRSFARITLPLMMPSFGLSFLLSLIFAIGAFASPLLLGSPEQFTLGIDVQRQAFENLNWPKGAAEAVLMVVMLLVICAPMILRGRPPAGRKSAAS